MRSLIFLVAVLVVTAISNGIECRWGGCDVDPLNENDSIDSVFEKKGYFAFKLKNEKLQRRVLLIQELSKQQPINYYGMSNRQKLNESFVLASALDLRIAGFYYDESEHKERMNATFSEIARLFCTSFPRFLTFNRFVLDEGVIRGRLQESDIDEQPVKKILSNNGFTYRSDSDISRGENSGFVVVRNHTSLLNKKMKQLDDAAKIFLQKPLRTSVFVDTLYACIENATGTCEEIASVKIEKCVKDEL